MCKLVEDYANMRAAEEAQKTAKETARRAFAMGLPIESVEQLVKLSTKELEKIAAEVHIARYYNCRIIINSIILIILRKSILYYRCVRH